MSYCHLLAGSYDNIALTLGAPPGGHPYGIMPERVPTRQKAHVVAQAASYPGCLDFVGGGDVTLSVTKAGAGTGTVTSAPAGINCGADCSEPYPQSTVVTLTAVADAGSTFAGWSGGGCSGTGTCGVTLISNTTVTATFTSDSTPCRTPNLALADPGSRNDSMTMSGSDTIGDLDLSLEITHSWVGDLTITLEHLDTGTTVTVVDRPGYAGTGYGCGGDNIMATLDDEGASPVENECAASTPTINGSCTPNNALSAFDGESLNGTWKLTVSDAEGGYSGTLDEWCLIASPGSGAIFSDGFESGDTSQWSLSVP